MDTFSGSLTKDTVFSQIIAYLNNLHFKIQDIDKTRPWGGFLVISDSSLQVFANHFFPTLDISIYKGLKLSPKILVVEPDQRLSWQYHKRRSELWTITSGEIGMVLSDDDTEPAAKKYGKGETIAIEQGKRHRAIGLENWGIIAEIWQHTDPGNPSNEEDIIRLQDDYGR